MWFIPDGDEHITQLQEELGRAVEVTPALMVGVPALAEARSSAPGNRDRTGRIRQFIRAETWTDAAHALLEFGLPQWNCIALSRGQRMVLQPQQTMAVC